jgi:hypothetical protein
MQEWVSACCRTIHIMPQYTQRVLLEGSHFARREGGCERNDPCVCNHLALQAAVEGGESECLLHDASTYAKYC